MYLYPESMTVVARYLLPELDEAACCLHCREKLHVVNPVAIHRLCGIVLCESCFSNALIDYHSSPLVGRTPPCCPSCHHSLTEENLNLTLPPLRYAVRDSLSLLPSQIWRQELERQQAQQVLDFSTPQGFGHVYEPILFGGKNAIGEEFVILPDGAAVRAQPASQPIQYQQMQQELKDLREIMRQEAGESRQWREEQENYLASWCSNNKNGNAPWYDQNQHQNHFQGGRRNDRGRNNKQHSKRYNQQQQQNNEVRNKN
jgi:hypothetical protein